MNPEDKISPAFEPFLEHTRPDDKRDAIVLFRAPDNPGNRRLRGRLRSLQERLAAIEDRAKTQKSVGAKLIRGYQDTSRKSSASQNLDAAPIGSGILPINLHRVTRRSLSDLAARPEVVAVIPNQRINLIRPKEINYSTLERQEHKDKMTWGLKALGIPEMWERTRGEEINVAVLDTGVHGDHAALKGRVREFVVIDSLGRRIKTEPSFDPGTHGTHVCGTIAGGKTGEGVSIGVAPEANLFVAGVLVGDSTLSMLLEGISWAVEQGADIINMSLGFTYYEPYFADFFTMLIEQYGVLPVVAIGNENHGNCSSPGNAHSSFSVGAIEKMPGRNKHEVAFFSSGASLVFPGAEPHALVTKPDVVAPGVQTYSCIPPVKRPDHTYEYSYMDGTSMATPHVAGVAALLMAAKPDAPVTEIIGALKDTAKHPSGAEMRPDNRWGYGIIQPVAALNALG